MSTANLTNEQLDAFLAADNAMMLAEVYLPLAEQGHNIDFLRLHYLLSTARKQMQDAMYATPMRECDKVRRIRPINTENNHG